MSDNSEQQEKFTHRYLKPMKVTSSVAVELVQGKTEGIQGLNDEGEVLVMLKVAPDSAKANAAIIAFIAKRLDIDEKFMKVSKGSDSKHKLIYLDREAYALAN